MKRSDFLDTWKIKLLRYFESLAYLGIFLSIWACFIWACFWLFPFLEKLLPEWLVLIGLFLLGGIIGGGIAAGIAELTRPWFKNRLKMNSTFYQDDAFLYFCKLVGNGVDIRYVYDSFDLKFSKEKIREQFIDYMRFSTDESVEQAKVVFLMLANFQFIMERDESGRRYSKIPINGSVTIDSQDDCDDPEQMVRRYRDVESNPTTEAYRSRVEAERATLLEVIESLSK